MPTLGALVGHETGGWEEYAYTQKLVAGDVDTFANFGIPAPVGIRESYCLRLNETTVAPKAVRSKAFAYANGIGGSARLYLTNNAADPYIDLLRMTNADGTVIHARVRLRSDAKVSLIDANGTEQAVSANTLSAPDWFDVYWKWKRDDTSGRFYVWLQPQAGGDTVSAFTTNADFSGGTGDVAVALYGQLGTASVPCNIYVLDLHERSGVSTSLDGDELVLTWEVLGPYQPDHATAAVVVGSGPLDAGYWENAAQTPTGSATIGYNTADYWGCQKTSGASKCGPNGDARVDGDILGASWIYRIGGGNVSCYYGHEGDYTEDAGIYTRNQNAQFVLDAADSRCPTKTEEFLQGFKCVAGGGRATLIEAWSFLLHVPGVLPTGSRVGLGSIWRPARTVLAT